MELRRAHEQQLTELYAEIGKLSTKARLAEKKVTTLSREERVALVERAQGELPLSQQADLLSLSRASFYYQPRPPSAAEVQLKHCIDAHLHAVSLLRFPEDCSTVTAGRDGHQSENRGAVYERDGHRGHLPGAESEQAQSERRSVSVRDSRHITSAYPNHIRVIDITYIRLHAGWMYLVAILDWYSRYVVSWELDQTLELPFVLTAVQRADADKPCR